MQRVEGIQGRWYLSLHDTYYEMLTIHVSEKVVLVIAQHILPGVNNAICVDNI